MAGLNAIQASQMGWTEGVGKALRTLGDLLMKVEYANCDPTDETRTSPELMVMDMTTGTTILLKVAPHKGGKTDGDGYVRFPDYEQSNPMRIPPTLKEAIMLDKLAGMLGGRIATAVMREIAEAMVEANELRLSADKETYKNWIDEHAKYPDELKGMLDELRQSTIKNQKGDTLLAMQAIPHMVAMASIDEMYKIVGQYMMEEVIQ